MKIGKLSPDLLKSSVLRFEGAKRPEVLVGALLGEDSAIIDMGDQLLAISVDPITGASAYIGRLAVHVSCNDVVSNGAEPFAIQVLLLMSVDNTVEEVEAIMKEISETAREIGVQVVGGHTEFTDKVTEPIIAIIALGKVTRNKLSTSTGAKPGDRIVISKGAGIEGTAILAEEYRDMLSELSETVLDKAARFYDMISIVPEGRIATSQGVRVMHDATEGGVIGALWEVAEASNVGFTVDRDKVPVRLETKAICDKLGIDPLRLLSSGTLIMITPEPDELLSELQKAGIDAAVIGLIEENPERRVIVCQGEEVPVTGPTTDELWRLKSPK
ncbi:MAG: AIR synthase family protein [Bacillota bacterium]|jgi:hydrogenase expression/formation protein HypE|nr:AIR synthase family protein [Bacillota bacterium]NLU54799.1 AIR synthase [Bacillota bacterium]HOA91788.1 AIR synthase family protein [Bacillota bacterium]HOJ46385.1 AIR synthase family protein [Bacillota bacterium]HOL14077.1 AIR synthase family protein [Bacillota bacterium]